MSGFWRGYASVNDDIRHTYERVFFGRETTENLNAAEVPGMVPQSPAASFYGTATPPGQTEPGQINPDQAAFYGSVWGNGDAPPIGPGGPGIGPQPTPGGAAVEIEAPKIEPMQPAPSQGNDLTPGY